MADAKTPEDETLDAIKARMRKARDAWIADVLKGSKVEDKIKKAMSEQFDSMLWYVLGLEKRWNEWSMSRVNGREPAIAVALQDIVKEKAEGIVREALEDGGLPPLTKEQKQAIRKEYRDRLAWRVRERAGALAESATEDMIEELVREVQRNETDMVYCPRCEVKHLEPIHELEN